ncbi:MAG: pyridoxal phosphate-dependent aminotransferase [Pseudomonadales bacterium]|nr:pyridoxal phosphate-dependent aminotransferase [Pseudomonadales bacterium]
MKAPPLSSLPGRISVPQAKVWELTNRGIEMDAQGADIIHLGIGDPDMDTHHSIVAAATLSLNQGRTHYPPLSGEPKLRSEIAKFCSSFYGQELSSAHITVFPGVQAALYANFQCLVEQGDEVILLEPCYATYPAVIAATGATAVYAELDSSNGFRLDIARVESLVNSKTRAILINSPANPSGMVYSASELRALLDLCQQQSLWLVADEVYADLVYDDLFSSALSCSNALNNVIVLRSFSKSHAMTGWRIGWSITSPSLAGILENLSQAMFFGVSQFTQDAAIIGLKNFNQIVPHTRQTYLTRRNNFCKKLEQIPKLKIVRPQGGMFALVDVSALGCDGEQFANRLLDNAGISVVPGFAFGNSTKNCVRIGLCQSIERLDEAAKRLEIFVREYDNK